MATFTYNNGTADQVDLSKQLQETEITISATITFTDPNTQIAGHSIINLNGNASIEDVQFNNYQLGPAANLDNQKLAVIVNVSKITMAGSNVATTTTAVTCQLQINGNGTMINQYVLDDSAYSENNSVFVYIFSFSTITS
jgi:hypothetical protein